MRNSKIKKTSSSLKKKSLKTIDASCKTNCKTKLEQLEELGLLGNIIESEITSTNYKEHIIKLIKEKL